MTSNIPLHSMVESSWMVPRDESLECSLFILEQHEKEYNDKLSSISNIAAPDFIGMRQSSSTNAGSAAGSISVGTSSVSARTSTPNNRSTRSSRSSRRQSSGPRTGYGYAPVATPTASGSNASGSGGGTAGSSRRLLYTGASRRETSSGDISTIASIDTAQLQSPSGEHDLDHSSIPGRVGQSTSASVSSSQHREESSRYAGRRRRGGTPEGSPSSMYSRDRE